MTPHWDAAPGTMREVLTSVSAVLCTTDFYLAGGTALALLEGHRVSCALDLFSPTFDDTERTQAALLGAYPSAVVTSVAPRTLYLTIESTIVSLFGYSYLSIAPHLHPDAELLPFASREDIAAMKLAAIASRGSRKDFLDLWVLTARHWPLARSLELYQKKFANRDVGHVVRSLTYFEDADAEPPLRLLIDVEWDAVKRELTNWVAALL